MAKELLFVPLTKVDLVKREVWGVGAQEVADKSGEIMDYASSKPLFESWSSTAEKMSGGLSLGNVREMHGKSAAGKLTMFKANDDSKLFEVCAKVVDDAAWKKVTEGVYTGFSIGGSYAKRWEDADDKKLMRYTASPSEISLVDSPCIPTATFTMVKADGIEEQVEFKRVEKTAKKLQKGMYGVSCLANIIASLKYCADDAKFEALYEKDGSEVPAKLNEAISMLGDILVQMAQEEVKELIPEEDKMTDAEKTQFDAMQKMILEQAELLKKLAPPVVIEKKEMTDEEKAKKKKDDEEAEKAAKAADMQKVIDDLTARLAKMEALPAADSSAKPRVFAFGKEADTNMTKNEKPLDPNSALDLVKMAHRNGKELSKDDMGGYLALAKL